MRRGGVGVQRVAAVAEAQPGPRQVAIHAQHGVLGERPARRRRAGRTTTEQRSERGPTRAAAPRPGSGRVASSSRSASRVAQQRVRHGPGSAASRSGRTAPRHVAGHHVGLAGQRGQHGGVRRRAGERARARGSAARRGPPPRRRGPAPRGRRPRAPVPRPARDGGGAARGQDPRPVLAVVGRLVGISLSFTPRLQATREGSAPVVVVLGWGGGCRGTVDLHGGVATPPGACGHLALHQERVGARAARLRRSARRSGRTRRRRAWSRRRWCCGRT